MAFSQPPGALLAGALALALPTGAGASAHGHDFTLSQVAAGVYVHQGVHENANRDNGNDLANIGFVVGNECVAVIDSGGSPAIGRRLKAAMRRVTDLPVCYVINTHTHPDHVLGNAAFQTGEVVFVGHENLPRALAARASTYLERLGRLLGIEPQPDWIVLPERTVSDTATLDLGGRRLTLKAWPPAHTNNDLTVFDAATGTLFTGDLVFVDRVPSLDGSINGWLAVLAELTGLPGVTRIVPGHGPPSAPWPQAVAPLRDYLHTLRAKVRRAIDEGRSIEYAIEHIDYARASQWLLFDLYHHRNVTAAFAELEWE